VKGNLTKVTDVRGGVTNLAYDSSGQITTMTDSRGQAMSFNYDSVGNPIKVTNPAGGTSTSLYDGIGRVVSQTDAKTQTFKYTYDGIDRLTQLTRPDGTTTTYTYSCCKLSTITDPSGTLNFVYDTANRLTRFTNASNQVIQYGYDAASNVTTLTYPDGKVVRYDYDAANRLTKVTDWLNNTTTYNYDHSDLIGSVNSNGTLTAYQYDQVHSMVALVNARTNGSVISAYKYTTNTLGNRTTTAALEPISPVLSLRNVSATYDNDNRLVNAAGSTYAHDVNGNVTSISGNTSATYAYDAFNRLTSAVTTGQTTQYQYDGLGNRTVRTVNGKSVKYIVEPAGSIPEQLAETDNAGTITAYYVYGIGLISKVTPGGQSYFYDYDGTGNTVALTDSSANVVNTYAYDAFGNLSSNSTESVSNSFRYGGRFGVTDEGNGLLYMRARYYSTGTGRFINKDPIGLLGGSNLYAYAGNDPVEISDPSGTFPILAAGALIGGLGNLGYQIYSNINDPCKSWYSIDWWQVGRFTAYGAISAVAVLEIGSALSAEEGLLPILNNNRYLRVGEGKINGEWVNRISIWHTENFPAGGWVRYFSHWHW
jgi:RHS repeat-associated protein